MTIITHPIIEGILNYIKKNEHVDGLVVYGSHVTNTANAYSDIDFYYIPNKEDYSLCHQFIIEDIGYDLWPISWENLEAISMLNNPMSSLVLDSLLIYSKDTSVETRFNELKKRLEANLNDETILTAKRRLLLNDIKGLAYEYLTKNHFLDEILSKIHLYLSYKNNTYIKKSTANILKEINEYTYLPKAFKKNFSEAIMGNTEAVVQLIDALDEGNEVYNQEHLSGFYEEMKSTYNKVIHGIETKDSIKIFFAVHSIIRETKWVLKEKYQALEFPDIATLLVEERLKIEDIKRHEEILVNYLKEEKIEINAFETTSEYLSWLEAR